jgi:hypothetical protein
MPADPVDDVAFREDAVNIACSIQHQNCADTMVGQQADSLGDCLSGAMETTWVPLRLRTAATCMDCAPLHGALKVPAQRRAGSPADNADFLAEHGRLVVKPARGEQGKGITVNVRTTDMLEQAVGTARAHAVRRREKVPPGRHEERAP